MTLFEQEQQLSALIWKLKRKEYKRRGMQDDIIVGAFEDALASANSNTNQQAAWVVNNWAETTTSASLFPSVGNIWELWRSLSPNLAEERAQLAQLEEERKRDVYDEGMKWLIHEHKDLMKKIDVEEKKFYEEHPNCYVYTPIPEYVSPPPPITPEKSDAAAAKSGRTSILN